RRRGPQWHRRGQQLRRQATQGSGGGRGGGDLALEPGAGRRPGEPAQARQAQHVRTGQVRPATPARALSRRSSLAAEGADGAIGATWSLITKSIDEPPIRVNFRGGDLPGWVGSGVSLDTVSGARARGSDEAPRSLDGCAKVGRYRRPRQLLVRRAESLDRQE